MDIYTAVSKLPCLALGDFDIVTLHGTKQLSDEWFKAREFKITASKLAPLLGMWGSGIRSECYRVLKSAPSGMDQPSSEAIRFGCAMEQSALVSYMRHMKTVDEHVRFMETSYVPHPRMSYAGATPDGRVELAEYVSVTAHVRTCTLCFLCSGQLINIEFKCPWNQGRAKLSLSLPMRYVPQVKMQMMCTGLLTTHLVIWSPAGCVMYTIDYDPVLAHELVLFIRDLHYGSKWVCENGIFMPSTCARMRSAIIRRQCKVTPIHTCHFESFTVAPSAPSSSPSDAPV